MLSQSFTSSGTFSWTAPSDTYFVLVECWGAGGGGGGAGNDINYDGADGGGAGAYAAVTQSVVPGSSYTVIVGRGGAPAADSFGTGQNGGVSWAINSASVLADGGGGGSTSGGGPGPSGGTVANSIGTTRLAGGNGGIAINIGVSTVKGGGGGGGAGRTSAGSNGGTAPNPGAGGSGNPGSGLGAGGSGSNSAGTVGSVGRSAGGGGGGATTNTTPLTTIRAGGSGSDGYVILTWNDQVNYPVTITSGTLDVMGSNSVVNPAFFPVSRSVAATSNSFATLLPDPYFFQTQSSNVSVSTNGVSSSVSTFSFPTRPEKQYYMSEGLLQVSSVSASVTGPRVSIDRTNLGDGFFYILAATSLTAFSVLNQGSKDARATASMATVVANNTGVPVITRGLFSNSTTTQNFSNTTFIEPSASINVTSRSGSVFYQHFLGYSSSLTPFSSSQSPIALISGTLNSISAGSQINPIVLPSTQTLWSSASLKTTRVTSSNSAVWSTVFTLTGMQDNKRYLVNHFLKIASDIQTGSDHRVVSASNINGYLLPCGSSNNVAISTNLTTSSGSGQLVNTQTGNTFLSNSTSGRLYIGEYTLTKVAGQNPTIDIRTKVNGAVTYANSGSVVFWRLIE